MRNTYNKGASPPSSLYDNTGTLIFTVEHFVATKTGLSSIPGKEGFPIVTDWDDEKLPWTCVKAAILNW